MSGENDNEKNLITGTRYLNIDGMLPYENRTAEYIRQTGNHVLYRVTPVFSGQDQIADGALMEAESVEDNGLMFCVYCYNVQPGITINYLTGDSSGPDFEGHPYAEYDRIDLSSEKALYAAQRNLNWQMGSLFFSEKISYKRRTSQIFCHMEQ